MAEVAAASAAADHSREPLSQRELEGFREVLRALIEGAPAIRVYRLVLKRSAPLVGARFGCVFVEDGRTAADGKLLKLACAHNWPQSAARFMSEFRIRIGLGGTGLAVAEGSPVEVPDLFADPALDEWWEPARELGFSALASFPLGGRAGGAVSYYFDGSFRLDEHGRLLLALYADLVAVAADRERLLAELKEANRRVSRDAARLSPLPRRKPTGEQEP